VAGLGWLAATASNGRPPGHCAAAWWSVHGRAGHERAIMAEQGAPGLGCFCLTGTVVARRELAGPAVQPSLGACYCCAPKICYQLGGSGLLGL
jgi:hypothetical protein